MIRSLFFILLVLVCSFSFGQDFPERPKPSKLVNDFANILGDREELILEKKLVAYNDSTSTQIAVVTINSNAGYESLLYNKPVVVLGDPFYKRNGLTFNVNKSLNNLPQQLKRAIKTKKINEDKVFQLVNGVLKSHYSGSYFDFNRGYMDFNFNKNNIKKIVDSFEEELK